MLEAAGGNAVHGRAVARIKHRRLRRVAPRPSTACRATVSCSRKLFDRSEAQGVFSRGSRGLPAQGIRQEVRSAEATIELNLRIRNSSITEFAFTPKRHMLVGYNAIPHLDSPEYADWITYS